MDPPEAVGFRQQSVEELNRLSRESRRVEIEMEDRGRETKRRVELDGDEVEVTPKIVRVGTDGWGRD